MHVASAYEALLQSDKRIFSLGNLEILLKSPLEIAGEGRLQFREGRTAVFLEKIGSLCVLLTAMSRIRN